MYSDDPFRGPLCINVPIAFILGIVTVAAAFSLGYEQVLVTIASDMASGIDSFTLLAIPFFIFSGDLMGQVAWQSD